MRASSSCLIEQCPNNLDCLQSQKATEAAKYFKLWPPTAPSNCHMGRVFTKWVYVVGNKPSCGQPRPPQGTTSRKRLAAQPAVGTGWLSHLRFETFIFTKCKFLCVFVRVCEKGGLDKLQFFCGNLVGSGLKNSVASMIPTQVLPSNSSLSF